MPTNDRVVHQPQNEPIDNKPICFSLSVALAVSIGSRNDVHSKEAHRGHSAGSQIYHYRASRVSKVVHPSAGSGISIFDFPNRINAIVRNAITPQPEQTS